MLAFNAVTTELADVILRVNMQLRRRNTRRFAYAPRDICKLLRDARKLLDPRVARAERIKKIDSADATHLSASAVPKNAQRRVAD